MIRPIDDTIAVAPQITPEDVETIRAAGFRMIVNNRPEEEEPGQPSGEAVAAAAAAAGLGYVAIPITHAGFSLPQVEAMGAALAGAEGPLLAYCRSGTRSCHLWALAAVRGGESPDSATAKAAAAGYDISGIRPLLDQLATQR